MARNKGNKKSVSGKRIMGIILLTILIVSASIYAGIKLGQFLETKMESNNQYSKNKKVEEVINEDEHNYEEIVQEDYVEKNSANPKIDKYITVNLSKEGWVMDSVGSSYVKRDEGYIYMFIPYEDEEEDKENVFHIHIMSSNSGGELGKITQNKIRTLESIPNDYNFLVNTEFYEVEQFADSIYRLYDEKTKDQFYITNGELSYSNIDSKFSIIMDGYYN